MTKQLFIAADHGGFYLKNNLKDRLANAGYAVRDLGAPGYDPNDDYPPFAQALATEVSRHPDSRGILICRSGQGVAIVANKFPGIRAALAWNSAVAAAGRTDDDVNVLCLPADYIHIDLAEQIVLAWLTADLKADAKYQRRLDQIRTIETQLAHHD